MKDVVRPEIFNGVISSHEDIHTRGMTLEIVIVDALSATMTSITEMVRLSTNG